MDGHEWEVSNLKRAETEHRLRASRMQDFNWKIDAHLVNCFCCVYVNKLRRHTQAQNARGWVGTRNGHCVLFMHFDLNNKCYTYLHLFSFCWIGAYHCWIYVGYRYYHWDMCVSECRHFQARSTGIRYFISSLLHSYRDAEFFWCSQQTHSSRHCPQHDCAPLC